MDNVMDNIGKFAIVTGASTGIGFELARCCAHGGYELLVVADEAAIEDAAAKLRAEGAKVACLQADLSTTNGVDELIAAAGGRPIDALLANAGRGLGRAFLDQDWAEIRKVVDTNIVGTIYLLHKAAKQMQTRNSGKILITGSIAGFMPGTFQAVYNGTKAFLDSFSLALRNEMKESGVTVTCLMPGATETEFFKRGDLMDTKVGTAKKDDAADVAKVGYEAMQDGKDQVVYGVKNKLQAAAAHILPASVTSELHRGMAEPGTARNTR
jgi:short-subunit dehydrogenase